MQATRAQQTQAEQSAPSNQTPTVSASSSPSRPSRSITRPSSSSSAKSNQLNPGATRKLQTSPSLRRSNYNTITASAATASVERLPRTSSPSSNLDSSPVRKSGPSPLLTSPRKKLNPTRSGRDFEILLASDETYVLRNTDSPELQADNSVDDAESFRSSSSSSSNELHDKPETEQQETRTPRIGTPKLDGPKPDLFASPNRVIPAFGPQGRLFNGTLQAPPSPDRTTSLQNHHNQSARAEALASASHRLYKAMPEKPQGSTHVGAGNQSTNGNSVSLQQEVEGISSKLSVPNSDSATISFRQRMKKTSGLLRKLRGDSGQEPKDKTATPAKQNGFQSSNAVTGSNSVSSAPTSNSMQTNTSSSVGSFRRESVASAGASSTSSRPSRYISADREAAPTVMKSSAGKSSPNRSPPLDLDSSLSSRRLSEHRLTIATPDSTQIPRTYVQNLRESDRNITLPQRSTSQGSINEAQTINSALRTFETEMDDALRESPREAVFTPSPSLRQKWSLSPQLPDLNIQRYKERNGSFLEESDFIDAQGRRLSTATVSPSGAFSAHPDTPLTATSLPGRIRDNESLASQSAAGSSFDSAANGRLLPVNTHMMERGVSPIDSVPSIVSSRRNSTDSIRSSKLAHDQLHRLPAPSGASLASVRSFETAAESTAPGSVDAKTTTSPYLSERLLDSHNGSRAELDTVGLFNADPNGAPDIGNEGDETIRNLRPEDEAKRYTDVRGVNGTGNSEVASYEASVVEKSEKLLSAPMSAEISNTSSTDNSEAPHRSIPSIALLSAASRQEHSPLKNSSLNSFDIQQRSVREDLPSSANTPPSLNAQDLAAKCWSEDSSFLKREKFAEWLGGLGSINLSVRTLYFQNFDFVGLRVDNAFRKLCEKLFLRAETQQIDRILASFSHRYVECNPESVFGNADVVHSVVFSILLLNTDLHVAELQDRMTRHQFVRNTMGAIAESNDEVPTPFVHNDDGRSSFSASMGGDAASLSAPRITDVSMTRSLTQPRASISSYADSGGLGRNLDVPNPETTTIDASRPSMVLSTSKGTQAEVEQVLKDIYAAVKLDRILLPTPDSGSVETISGRPSGTFGGNRRKLGTDRMTALKRGSIRGIRGLLGPSDDSSSELGSSSSSNNLLRGSLDVRNRSANSLAPVIEKGNFNPSSSASLTPGFASTLSQTIIKETRNEDVDRLDSSKHDTTEEDDDNLLALSGPPWAKEGTLTRKYYWESPGKRGKDKGWAEVFVVISKGTLSMFRFDLNSSTAAAKSRAAGVGGSAMGGGNWLSSATCLGEMSLAHSLANALPPPGYNRARPHVFALTLAGGAVYFFQAGHEELIHEWVSTCNYWAGRMSKEPLPGGVSNMEYGWNKVLPPMDDYEMLDSASLTDSSGPGTMTTSASTGGKTGTSSASWSNPPDASIYQGTTLLGQPQPVDAHQRATDSKSVKSHKSTGASGGGPRSLRSRVYQNWTDATGFVSSSVSSTNLAGAARSGKPADPPFSPEAASIRSSAVGGTSNERIFINDWRIPAAPTVASTLSEETQLARLERQVVLIEAELTIHTSLHTPMLSLYTPKGTNASKSLANWERKSNHLLQELVKYQTYVEALRKSVDFKAEKHARREVQAMIDESDSALAQIRI